jgi:anti-sigma factor RsiW
MTLPHAFAPDDQQLVRYVLGLLPDEEAERLDEASIADDELALRLRVVEDDLVDSYVRGRLPAETRERFESYYLASPRRAEQVSFAAKLVRAIDRAATQADAETGGEAVPVTAGPQNVAGSAQVVAWPTRSRLRFVLSPGLAAAAAVLLILCGALAFQAMRLGQGLSVARSENVALDRRTRELERQLADQRAANDTATTELARARAVRTAPSPPAAPDANAGTTLIAALLLLPQTRAIGPIPTLTIPAGADRVMFELRLDANDFSQYRLGLQDPATNRVVWRSGWIAPASAGDQASLTVAVPATLLKPQHYSFELAGRGGSAGAEVVGSYAFQIVPR